MIMPGLGIPSLAPTLTTLETHPSYMLIRFDSGTAFLDCASVGAASPRRFFNSNKRISPRDAAPTRTIPGLPMSTEDNRTSMPTYTRCNEAAGQPLSRRGVNTESATQQHRKITLKNRIGRINSKLASTIYQCAASQCHRSTTGASECLGDHRRG